MKIIRFNSEDMLNIRFAYSPLLEIPFSYRVLITPEFQSPHRRWVEETRRALHDAAFPYMDALIISHGYIPDFLTPTPLTSRVHIADEFQELLSLPDDLIRRNVQEVIAIDGETEMRRFFLAHPHEAIQCLIEDLQLYWLRALKHRWSQMISVLEGDLLYRGRLMALDGPEALLPDLHPTISYQNREIHLANTCTHIHPDFVAELNGDGIQLVPTVFTGCGRAYQISPEWHPMIVYSARGAGLYNGETRASKPLELALGTGRARVLQGLRHPATTGELAHRLQLTSGAVSQQLDRLKRAGLVESYRSGKRVYYQLTQRGEELMALFDRIQ